MSTKSAQFGVRIALSHACALNFHVRCILISFKFIHSRKKNPKIKKNSIDHEFTSPPPKKQFCKNHGTTVTEESSIAMSNFNT